jgi:hypothetical protein
MANLSNPTGFPNPTPRTSVTSNPPPYSEGQSSSAVTSFRMQLANLLGIPTHLVGPGDVSLSVGYQKYRAYLTACSTLDQMVAEKTWLLKKPSKTKIVEIFVSKSFFHFHYKRLFSKVAEYPEMVAWLECKEDRLMDVEVWHVEKPTYVFKDLEMWLDNGGTLEMKVEQTKKKEKKEKKGGKDKEKDKESKKTKKKGKKESSRKPK